MTKEILKEALELQSKNMGENDGFYTLNIFNINGQLINRLKSEEGKKGIEYSVIWDAKNLLGQKVPSGLYLYQLETAGGSLSKKMLLIKQFFYISKDIIKIPILVECVVYLVTPQCSP